jgi:cyclophilin family peptidyl-prolyl cis-trans isomerase/HEAT repeat protein
MRLPRSAWFAAALVLLVTGCPKTPTTTSPAETRREKEDAQVGKLARILHAADRRIVDDDLRALLADEDATVRAKAALALGQIAEPSSLRDLEKAATDAVAEPRANVAFAMGLIADPSAGAALLQLAGDASPLVRAAAAEALGRLHDAGGAPAVQALLDDPDLPVRAAAALCAWKFAEPGPFLDALIANLAATEPDLRTASAYALARLASAAFAPASSGAPVGHLSAADATRARSALAERVTDPEPEVRMQVARGLASPQGGAEFAVLGALSKDRNPGVRVNAVRSLGYPGVSIKPYLERAMVDRDHGVAYAALEAVGAVGGSAAIEALKRVVVKLDSAWLRGAALIALAHADPSNTPDIVSGLLMNPDPVMRGAAAALVVGRKEPGAIRAALALLGDPEPRVQALAVPIIADQDGPISKLLAGFFRSPDPVVRAAVGDVVGGRFADPHRAVESRDDLFACLEEIWATSASDTIPDAKLAVVDAVAKAGKDERTRTALTRALADPDVVVRRRAAARFNDVYEEDRSKDVGPASDRPLSDYERIVRWARVPHAAVITMQRPGTATARFTVALDASAAPMAAWNFAELAGQKFFDGATLHRVVPNFVVQDGDPRGDGYGGPGYSIRDEFNPLPFTAGVLGMASDGKDTAGSQWFVTLSAQPHLDGRYTSFGRVVQGLREIVGQMRPEDTIVLIRVYEGNGTEPLPGN